MYLQSIFFVLSALSGLASAHFKLINPKPRGFNENTLGQYPCGGQNTPSAVRTKFPVSGAPVQLFLEHTITTFSVILALGNNPSPEDFTNVIVPTFTELGPRDFCIGDVDILGVLGSKAQLEMNATLLVTSNGDSGEGSGLYNCADITFIAASDAAYNAPCTNSTGVRVQAGSTKLSVNPNGTAIGGGGGSSGSMPGGSGGAGGGGGGNTGGQSHSHGGGASLLRADAVGIVFASVVVAAFLFLV